jgi:hypothetical protein
MHKFRTVFVCAVAAASGVMIAAPSFAEAQTRYEIERRQQKENEWRNIAIASGAIGVLGLLQKDQTLTFAGAAGALYSVHRMEQDRKSRNQMERARARYFDEPYFYRDGQRFERRTVRQNGQTYYQFVRANDRDARYHYDSDRYKNHGQRVSSIAKSKAKKNNGKGKGKGRGNW